MHESPFYEHIQLIEQLLSCPKGQEEEILQSKPELLNVELLGVMRGMAKKLESKGNSQAKWLLEFAEKLGERIKPSRVLTEIWTISFLEETLQLVASKEGDYRQIYPIWERQQAQFNPQLIVAMPEVIGRFFQAFSAYSKNLGMQFSLASTLATFGDLILQFPQGIRWVNLELSIIAYQPALEILTCEVAPMQWAAIQNNLAMAYFYRIQGERVENLEMAIHACELALQVRTRSTYPEDWAATQNNLAILYCHRLQSERADNLEKAILSSKLALEVYTHDSFPVDWAMAHNNLAVAYFERIQGERAENLEQALVNHELALQVITHEAYPEKWADAQNNLANVYLFRIRGKRIENIEKSIVAYKLALQAYNRDAFPERWADTQCNLANAYRERIQGERAENLETALNLCKMALEIYTRDTFPEGWAKTQFCLASVYTFRIEESRADNLEAAINAYELALQVYTTDLFPEMWAKVQNNLAITYRDRIRGERSDNLEVAINAHQLALQVFTSDAFPEQWATTQINLSAAYIKRIRGKRKDNIEAAIAAAELSLQMFTRDAFPEKWAMNQINLGNAYSENLYNKSSDNIEAAINAYNLALQVYNRETYPENWALTQFNLANTHLFRIADERTDNFKAAIKFYELALQVFTSDAFPEQWAMIQNNLGFAYNQLAKQSSTESTWDRQINSLEAVINAYSQALQFYTYDAFPRECRQAAHNLANCYFDKQSWSKAVNAYNIALNAAEVLYQSCTFLDGKSIELAETADLPRRSAYALARCGELQNAVETLEKGRARSLSESLERDKASISKLQQSHPHLYLQYQYISQQLRNIESQQRQRMTSNDGFATTPETLRNEAIRLRQTLISVLVQILQIPGYEAFHNQTSFDNIRTDIQPDKPLVYLVVTPAGSLALVVTLQTIETIWFDDFPENTLREILYGPADDSELSGWFGAYQAFRNNSKANYFAWHEEIERITRQLWDPLMAPLITHLQQHSFRQAILVPTGLFSFLPLHSAWTEDPNQPTGKHYALDKIHFTYAPNARSLVAAQEVANHTQSDAILAINEPKHRQEVEPGIYKDLNPLPSSTLEVNAAISTFQNPKILRHTDATREAVIDILADYNVLHFSCHGGADLQEPLKSGLALTGEGQAAILTLRDLLDLKLTNDDRPGIRLAILSACETGLPGIENVDEAISLPTGLLQAGVAGVVASLWSVSDLSTMLLISKFYELWRIENREPSEALRQAQNWLRDSTEAEIAPLLGMRPRNPTNQPFSHPYHWAAFSYTGV
ncbi:q110x8-triei tpr repeat containing protein [Leptolyngbya sp. Heron Island J]|nr:q110x8-triei tpr repeat containing protein [Leptolyngbya sp. Heron Island J]